MNEIDIKLARLRELMAQKKLDAVVLQRKEAETGVADSGHREVAGVHACKHVAAAARDLLFVRHDFSLSYRSA